MVEKDIKMYFSKRKLDLKQEPIEKKVKTEPNLRLQKVISGGQTGAYRGGLEAAEALGIETGGTVPHGFWTTDGKYPELGTRFKLKELSPERNTKSSISVMYIERSKKNVDDGDATIAFRLHPSVGTDKTIGYCLSKSWKEIKDFQRYARIPYCPLLVIDALSKHKNKENVSKFQAFI